VKECTDAERLFLDRLKRCLGGPKIYVTRERRSMYETVTFEGHNCRVVISGDGGPEPTWIYNQPTILGDELIALLKENGTESEIERKR